MRTGSAIDQDFLGDSNERFLSTRLLISPSMPRARDLLSELATVGFDQPDAQHVDVVDLPAVADAFSSR
jgi:hypothetical protein